MPAPSRVDRLTVAEAARRLGVAPKTIRNLLAAHRREFDAAVYGRHGRHPRKVRLLTARDFRRLDARLAARMSA